MSITNNIRIIIQKRKEKLFWNHPDNWLAAIILDENKEQVYGKVRNGLAILENIPKPETGYSYLDIVTVVSTTGKQMFREDEINEYKATGISKKSNIPTFTYKAILPKSRDYFEILDWFRMHGQITKFPWSPTDNNMEWRKGFCTAKNLDHARSILNDFINMDSSRKVKDIYNWDYYKSTIIH